MDHSSEHWTEYVMRNPAEPPLDGQPVVRTFLAQQPNAGPIMML